MIDHTPRHPSLERPPTRTVLVRGLRRRCPVCAGRVFESWFRPAPRCARCGFPTTRVSDQWIGAYGMNIIVSFVLLVATIAVGFAVTYPDPPVAVLLVVCVGVAVVVPVWLQPISRSLWAAIDVAMRAPEPADFVGEPEGQQASTDAQRAPEKPSEPR